MGDMSLAVDPAEETSSTKLKVQNRYQENPQTFRFQTFRVLQRDKFHILSKPDGIGYYT